MVAVVADASGVEVTLPTSPRRIISLVPSITEILFVLGLGDAVVGCTVYCSEPREGVATKTRVGGEKNPKLEVIRDLRPDLVLANVEENVRSHVETLRSWGIPVHVSYPRTVAEGIRLIGDLGRLTGATDRATEMVTGLEAGLADTRARLAGHAPARVFCPIWRNPYMTINGDTYMHDMLAVCGGTNVFGGLGQRYPQIDVADVARERPDVMLLPDEPYRFRRAHLADFSVHPEIPALREGRVHLIDGKLLSWYGPRIAQALTELPELLGDRPVVS